MSQAATESAQGMVDLTGRLMGDLHAVGLLVRSGGPLALERPLLGRMSICAAAILDQIEVTVPALGELPADTGDEVRQQVAEALSAVRLFERVLEFSRL